MAQEHLDCRCHSASGETEKHYNYFRDYDAAIGRYLQSDPTGPTGGFNTYAYVDVNPLNWRDLFGLQIVVPGGGVIPAPGTIGNAASSAIARGLTRLLCDSSENRKCQ